MGGRCILTITASEHAAPTPSFCRWCRGGRGCRRCRSHRFLTILFIVSRHGETHFVNDAVPDDTRGKREERDKNSARGVDNKSNELVCISTEWESSETADVQYL